MEIPLIITYVTTVGLSFLISLRSFREDFSIHLKVFSLLLGLTLLVEIGAATLPKLLHLRGNNWLYNSFTLIEFSVYAWYYQKIVHVRWIKTGIIIFRLLFPLFWFITVFFVFGFNGWNSYVIIVGAFFTVCFALSYYYQLLNSENVVLLSRDTEFWIATGMIILYSCQIPFFGMLNFLNKNYPGVAGSLYLVLLILNNLMYLFFIYAYLCKKRKF